MQIRHDREGDVIKITLNDRQQTHGKMVLPDVILRLDENNRIVAIEILSASENIPQPEISDYTDITHPRFEEKIASKTGD